MDDNKLRIIAVLKKNGRMKYSEIAKAVDLPATTVHTWVNKMRKDGIISFVMNVNHEKLTPEEYERFKEILETYEELEAEIAADEMIENAK